MAAVTETNRVDHSLGSLKAVSARIASMGDTNTWDTGLGTVLWCGVTDEGKTGYTLGCTLSGGRVTFASESGTPAVNVLAIGY